MKKRIVMAGTSSRIPSLCASGALKEYPNDYAHLHQSLTLQQNNKFDSTSPKKQFAVMIKVLRACLDRLLLIALTITFSALAHADLSPEQVLRAKEATALLVNEQGSGTAFCISDTGIFITCNHVITRSNESGLAIVVNPTGRNEKRYPVKVLRKLEKSDIAILKVDLDPKVPALKLGDDSGLFETQQLFAFGYPFGNALSKDSKSYPAISVNLGRVTSLRKDGDQLNAIQLDAQLNPGNSGGPVLDDKGNIVGIVSSGVRGGAGINFAIPVSLIAKTLNTPFVSVEAPSVKFEKRYDPAEFVISVDWILPTTTETKITVELTDSETAHRSIAATKSDDGKYRATVEPLPAELKNQKPKCQVSIEFDDGKLAGSIENFDLTIEGKTKPLSEISKIERSADGKGFTVDAKPMASLPEIAKLDVNLGGVKLNLNGQKAKRIEITPPNQNVAPISYRVNVSSADEKTLITSVSGLLKVGAPKVIPTTSSLKGAVSLTEKREFPLPSPAYEVVPAGDGRVLIFHLKDAKKLAVFDVVDLKIRGYINLAEEPVLYAGGSRHLLLIYPNQNLIQRFSLQTLEKEKTINNPFGEITNVAMGYSSQNIALLVISKEANKFFDTDKMAAITVQENLNNRRGFSNGKCILRSNADGRVYGIQNVDVSPSGFGVLTYNDGEASFLYEHESPGTLVPNSDGTLIFTTYSGVFSQKHIPIIKTSGNWNSGLSFMPSYHPLYFFSVPRGNENFDQEKNKNKTVSIYLGRSAEPLVSLPEPFEEMKTNESAPSNQSKTDAFTLDRRYHFYPQLDLFLTIPATNDKIVARPINVKKILSDKGIDYLYVTSIPPLARVAEPFQYQLEAVSKAGGVSFNLQSGPTGLEVSKEGNVTWNSPAKKGDETVIVALKDASGQETFYTFQVVVSE